MSTQDKLEGARNGLAFNYAYLNVVANEIGMDRAVELSSRADTMMGEAEGKRLRELAGGNDLDLNTAVDMSLRLIRDGFGISSEVIESTPNKVTVRCSRCPVFEAAQSVGIDTDSIEPLCRTGSIAFMNALVKQLNPDLSYHLVNFRNDPNHHCEEQIVLG